MLKNRNSVAPSFPDFFIYYFTWGTLLSLNNRWQSPLIYRRIKAHGGFAEGRVNLLKTSSPVLEMWMCFPPAFGLVPSLVSSLGDSRWVLKCPIRCWEQSGHHVNSRWTVKGICSCDKKDVFCQETFSSHPRHMQHVHIPVKLCGIFKWHKCFKLLGHCRGGSALLTSFPSPLLGVCAGRSPASVLSCYFQCLW